MYGLAYIGDGAERIKLWREIHGAGVNGGGESHSSKASHGPLGTNPLFSGTRDPGQGEHYGDMSP